MRLKILMGAAALAAALPAGSAAHAQTLSASEPGAVELRLSATGQSINRADFVTVYVPITTSGTTASAARAANKAAITAVTNSLVSHGVDRGAVMLLPAASRFGFVGNESYDSESAQTPQSMAAMLARKSAFSVLQIKLSDPTLLDRVRDALDEQNQTMSGAPLPSLKNDRAAKNAAIADALAKARQDAEAYAAPLGLRVVRVASVSNYGEGTPTLPDMNFVMRMMAGVPGDIPNNVTTQAQVWVTFTLTPR